MQPSTILDLKEKRIRYRVSSPKINPINGGWVETSPKKCVKNGRKGSIKAGGFGFGSLAVERKRYKRVALFSWSVERPLGTSLIGKRYGCQESKAVELEKTLDVTEVMVGCPGKVLNIDVNEDINDEGVNVGLIVYVKAYTAHYDNKTVYFEIFMTQEQMNTAEQEGILKKFKLTSTLSTTNMHLFDANGVIKKYDTPEQILQEFFYLRLSFYNDRKTAKLRELEEAILLLENKNFLFTTLNLCPTHDVQRGNASVVEMKPRSILRTAIVIDPVEPT
nr:DNA topoisomerase 2 [Tanacetum cinerariifolium]